MIRGFLARVAFLQVLAPRTVEALIAHGRRHAFVAGGVLVQQGEVNELLHVILTGRVRVERTHQQFQLPVVLVELGPGATVGELGLLDGAPQPVTAVAVVGVETFALSTAALARTLRGLHDGRTEWRRMLTWRTSLLYAQDRVRDAQA